MKALLSPGSYPFRWALWQLAMWAWDMVSTTHDIMAHTGFMLPHGQLNYPDNGELRLANEIDSGLISLGNSLDGSFAQALADATDPFGNLDKDPNLLIPPHNPRARPYPFLPVRTVQLPSGEVNEFRRPWGYPSQSRNVQGQLYPTPGEESNIRAEADFAGLGRDLGSILKAGVQVAAGTVSGPYPQGATPDQVFFRTGRPVSPAERAEYEQAPTPAHTDAVNERLIGRQPGTDHSPLGDPVQFCGYLMGQVVSPEYSTRRTSTWTPTGATGTAAGTGSAVPRRAGTSGARRICCRWCRPKARRPTRPGTRPRRSSGRARRPTPSSRPSSCATCPVSKRARRGDPVMHSRGHCHDHSHEHCP